MSSHITTDQVIIWLLVLSKPCKKKETLNLNIYNNWNNIILCNCVKCKSLWYSMSILFDDIGLKKDWVNHSRMIMSVGRSLSLLDKKASHIIIIIIIWLHRSLSLSSFSTLSTFIVCVSYWNIFFHSQSTQCCTTATTTGYCYYY